MRCTTFWGPLLCWLAIACSGDPAPGGKGEQMPVVDVQSLVVEPAPFEETLVVSGTVTSGRQGLALVTSPVAARVERVLITRDDPVRRGQPLVELDRSALLAEARQARIARNATRSALSRAERLSSAGVVPARDVEQARSAAAMADASVIVSERNLERSILRAPISGTVTHVAAVIDMMADPSVPLVEIVDPRLVEVVALVPAGAAARIRTRQGALLLAGVPQTSETLGTGTVRAIAAALDSISRSVEVRVVISRVGRSLRIGEAVDAHITLASVPDALVVPVDAIVPDGDTQHLFVVGNDGVARARAVTLGTRSRGMVRVMSGLRSGDRVVTAGAYGITDSARVRPKPASAPPRARQ